MNAIKRILNELNGLHYRQEYLCLAKESLPDPIHVYLVERKRIVRDITQEHLFTGYRPLIFTFASSVFSPSQPPPNVEVIFSQQSIQPNGLFNKIDALALLSLRLLRKQTIDYKEICHYEGTHGQHHFLSFFHQYVIGLNNRLYNKKKGNVFLNNDLYKQVQIAYSVPRIISLITVSTGGLYNLFPTDLHGPLDEHYYVSSLRHGGEACKQVEAARRVIVSRVHSEAYKAVYGLGKNHMQKLKTKENFSFSESVSETFNFPLPTSLLSYRELELVETFEHGIHKLLLYKIISSQLVNKDPSTLAHIHNCYATWRYHNSLPGNYLLR